jgi:hypothetical protein
MTMLKTKFRASRLAAALLLAISTAGCIPGYYPGGSMASLDLFTYYSTPDYPQNIKVVEQSTNTVIWMLEIPIGKQLVVQFQDDHDTKNVTRPALMRWEIMDIGTTFGDLKNSMPVPAATNRFVDVTLRDTPDAVPAPEPAAKPAS